MAAGVRTEEQRRKVQERLASLRESAAQARNDYEQARMAEAAKTRRLRALRLARETAEGASAAAAASEPPVKRARAKSATRRRGA